MTHYSQTKMLSSRIQDRLQQEETPFYLYDMNLLRATLEEVMNHASKYGYNIHYAIKANFEKEIINTIKEYGLGIDCVSGNEVRYAIENGFDPKSVVFAGVGKSDKEITYSLEQDIFAFNCESREELQVINSIAKSVGKIADVAFRINPDVDPKTHKNISTGEANSKFGISYKEIELLTEELSELHNVRITGLHFHIGSQILELEAFEHLCERANSLYDWFEKRGYNFTHINLGGGLGVNYENPESEIIPDFATYFKIFNDNLKLNENIDVHFELGRSIVAQSGELISRVLFNKTTGGGRNVAILDASMTELLRPALYDAYHSIENLSADNSRKSTNYIIAGTVCESTDIFTENIDLPELKRGDLVSIKTAGAYGSSMASRYNMHDLPRSIYISEDIE